MPEFLERYGQEVGEYWDPGYYFTGSAYVETMAALEDASHWIQYAQPTSGLTRFIGLVRLVVLSPSIGLRNRFDSYGVTPNNASISLKVEFPSSRVEQRDEERRYLRIRQPQALILGADAQTLSWAQVVLDFPELRPQDSPVANYLKMALGSNPLSATVFKVAHHGSKHGVNLELLELIDPDDQPRLLGRRGRQVQLPAPGLPRGDPGGTPAHHLGAEAEARLGSRGRTPLHVRCRLQRRGSGVDRRGAFAERKEATRLAVRRRQHPDGRSGQRQIVHLGPGTRRRIWGSRGMARSEP